MHLEELWCLNYFARMKRGVRSHPYGACEVLNLIQLSRILRAPSGDISATCPLWGCIPSLKYPVKLHMLHIDDETIVAADVGICS